MTATIETNEAGLPVRMYSGTGVLFYQAAWDGELLRAMRLRLPDRSWVEIRTQVAERPIFGLCDAVYYDGASEPITYFRAVHWARPEDIPPLEQPGSLPAGAGTMILNTLAWLAQHAKVSSLRYVGPYHTGALFDSLFTCFRVEGDPVEAFARFVKGVEQTSLQANMAEAPVDFIPAPFQPEWTGDGSICVQRRDELERAYIQGRCYHQHVDGPRRLRRDPALSDVWQAVVEIAGQPWAHVASFSSDGALIEGPSQLPELPQEWLGQPLHPGLRKLLADALPPRAPRLLQATLQDILLEVPMVWGDTGTDWAQIQDDRLVLHAGFAARAQQLGANVMLEAMARAVEPVAQRLAQVRLEKATVLRGVQG